MRPKDRKLRYPKIKDNIYTQLIAIKPSTDGKLDYYPCRVVLLDGRTIERVYVEEECPYIDIWGVYPEEDEQKNYISIDQIKSIEESPYRLPVRIANKIYKAGESGMGYCIFTLIMRNGDRLPYVTGNAVDFPNLPPGYSYKDIIDVLPHVGRENFQDKAESPYAREAEYWWCLYSK